jgi:asparagine synthase (glutamine-hydrolysing)
MCGITGVIKFNKIDSNLIKLQLESIKHRGPNENGYWQNENDNIFIGSTRLSILDLRPEAKMPQHFNQFHIVFNGELYNYKEIRNRLIAKNYYFSTNSDTEVVLKAYAEWGESCLSDLEGMYAIAIYDETKRKLFLARDIAGEKPLYYWNHSNGFSFASELKALFCDDDLVRKINYSSLFEYLQFGYIGNENSIIEGVKKLKPGHFLNYDLFTKKIEVKQFWALPKFDSTKVQSPKELIAKLDGLLHNSIENQMVADVPVGVLLSGGVDSSLITAIASQITTEKLKTFTISFPKFSKFDESQYSQQIAKYYGTEHFELPAGEVTPDIIDEIIEFLDEPMADSSLIPTYIVSKLTKKYVTVALSGDGGDELFGGYPIYKRRLQVNNSGIQKKLVNTFKNAISNLPLGLKGRNYLLEYSSTENGLNQPLFFDSHSLKKLLCPKVFELFEQTNQPNDNTIDIDLDIISKATRDDFLNYLPDDILVKTDRMSMANSLELRTPFLDKNIIEFAFSEVPTSLKVNNEELKILLKQLAQNYMPPNYDLIRKQGFSIPLKFWINNNWDESFQIKASDPINNIINISYYNKLMIYEKNSFFNNSNRLFAILILQKWLHKYKIVM